MMSLKLQIIILVCVILIMVDIVNKVRKKKIDLRFALGWLLIGFLVFLFTLFPQLLNHLAMFLGIASPVNMLFFVGFVFSLCVIFSLSVAISHLSEKLKKLAQELAILKKRIYENEKKEKDNSF